MAAKAKFTVQFSEDGSVYYVPEMAFKHVWLSVEKSPEIPTVPRLVMPYSGVCEYERREKYFRVFYNQSYFNFRLGKTETQSRNDELVRDYADAAAHVPQKAKGKTGELSLEDLEIVQGRVE